jgi:hypothetical protein
VGIGSTIARTRRKQHETAAVQNILYSLDEAFIVIEKPVEVVGRHLGKKSVSLCLH